ncbi:MAG: hypothetical protein ACKVZH_06635 [Blastocatellia bacterium]
MPFQININATISPPNIKAEIEQAFDESYKGERGDDESLAEFLERRLEEYVLSIYRNHKTQSAAADVTRTLTKSITADAEIKRKKMKPEPKPEPKPEQ